MDRKGRPSDEAILLKLSGLCADVGAKIRRGEYRDRAKDAVVIPPPKPRLQNNSDLSRRHDSLRLVELDSTLDANTELY